MAISALPLTIRVPRPSASPSAADSKVAAQINYLTAMCQALQKDNAANKQRLDTLHDEQAASKRTIRQLKKSLNAEQTKSAEVAERLSAAEQAIRDAAAETARLRAENGQLRTDKADLIKQNTQLQKVLAPTLAKQQADMKEHFAKCAQILAQEAGYGAAFVSRAGGTVAVGSLIVGAKKGDVKIAAGGFLVGSALWLYGKLTYANPIGKIIAQLKEAKTLATAMGLAWRPSENLPVDGAIFFEKWKDGPLEDKTIDKLLEDEPIPAEPTSTGSAEGTT